MGGFELKNQNLLGWYLVIQKRVELYRIWWVAPLKVFWKRKLISGALSCVVIVISGR